MTQDQSNRGEFEVKTVVCAACEMAEKATKASEGKDRPAGLKAYVINHLFDAERTPGRHEERLKAKRLARHQLESEGG